MGSESAILSFLSIISLTSFFVVLITKKFSERIKNGILLDKDFSKPQAFHEKAVLRSGGLAGIISLIFFFIFDYFLFQKFSFNYLVLSLPIFIIGFLEDLKFGISPNKRLVLMIVSLLIFIIFSSTYLMGISLGFLKIWMHSRIFSVFFILLCFLFIINGANLIDGFNGLLIIHLLIINLIILFINLDNTNDSLVFIITGQIVILFSLLLFNFPKASLFLGDSGSYLFGALTALNIIYTNNLNKEISSFFFCILLFYLFYEVFFSFFRKIFQKKSPFLPDKNHLHMLIFRKLKFLSIKNANPITGLIINLAYVSLILPALFNMFDPSFCRYWFFFLILIYSLIFYYFYKSEKF